MVLSRGVPEASQFYPANRHYAQCGNRFCPAAFAETGSLHREQDSGSKILLMLSEVCYSHKRKWPQLH